MKMWFVWIACFLFTSMARAADGMNGYTLQQFGDFQKNWHLVTVRYRQDTNEMRFTYANDLAWETLNAGKTDYPDGAIFGKVGVMTQPDPAFVSSVVPSGARRIQFMVRDVKKHKSDDGWGYALFDPQGKVFPDHGRAAVGACVTCHHIVADRGYVFSQFMSNGINTTATTTWLQRIPFKDVSVENIPRDIRKFLPVGVRAARMLAGKIAQSPFFGTLDEVQPILAAEAVRSKSPAILVGDKRGVFSVAILSPESGNCSVEKKEVAVLGVHSLPDVKKGVYKNSFCWPSLNK